MFKKLIGFIRKILGKNVMVNSQVDIEISSNLKQLKLSSTKKEIIFNLDVMMFVSEFIKAFEDNSDLEDIAEIFSTVIKEDVIAMQYQDIKDLNAINGKLLETIENHKELIDALESAVGLGD